MEDLVQPWGDPQPCPGSGQRGKPLGKPWQQGGQRGAASRCPMMVAIAGQRLLQGGIVPSGPRWIYRKRWIHRKG